MTPEYDFVQAHLVGYDYFSEWCQMQTNRNITNCNIEDILRALLKAQEYVYSMINVYNTCNCDINDLDEITLKLFKHAVSLYAYDYSFIAFSDNDNGVNDNSYEVNCFLFLKNNGLINV